MLRELFGQWMRLVHDKQAAVLLKRFEYLHQHVNFLMILVNIDQQTNCRMVFNDGTIAFISFNYQQLTGSNFCIADLSFFNNTYQSCTTDDARSQSCIL